MSPVNQYFYLDANGDMAGPCTFEELWRLHLAGRLTADTHLAEAGGRAAIRFGDLVANQAVARLDPAAAVGVEVRAAGSVSFVQRFAEKAEADLQMLIPHLLVPWREIKNFQWLDNRRLISIAAVGLLPLFIYEVGAESGNLRLAYWAMAFYFSALWAVFFYHLFPAPHVTVPHCLICFFGTGVLSVSVLLVVYQLPPFNLLLGLISVPNLFFRLLGFVFGVGVPEETCKVLVLLWLWRRRGPLPRIRCFFMG